MMLNSLDSLPIIQTMSGCHTRLERSFISSIATKSLLFSSLFMNLELLCLHFFSFFKSFLGLLHLMRWSSWSQHVVAKPNLSFLLGRFKNLEGTRQCIIHAHHCTSIIKLATIIWCWKYGYQLPLRKKLISIFHNLIIQK